MRSFVEEEVDVFSSASGLRGHGWPATTYKCGFGCPAVDGIKCDSEAILAFFRAIFCLGHGVVIALAELALRLDLDPPAFPAGQRTGEDFVPARSEATIGFSGSGMVAATDAADVLVSHVDHAADDGATGHGPRDVFGQILYRAQGALPQMAAFSLRPRNSKKAIGIPHPNLREKSQVHVLVLVDCKNLDDFPFITEWCFVKNKFSVGCDLLFIWDVAQ